MTLWDWDLSLNSLQFHILQRRLLRLDSSRSLRLNSAIFSPQLSWLPWRFSEFFLP